MLLDVTRTDLHFQVPRSFALLAYSTFGMTGAMAALRRGYDIVGVVFLAVISAGGGGLIRDGLLISEGPPLLLTDPSLLWFVLAAALLARLLFRFFDRLQRAILVIDALGLGAFAVVGVQTCLSAGLSIPGAVIGGTVTTVGGGLLRDIMVRDEPLVFKPGQFYALVAMGGCVLYIALLHTSWATPDHAAIATSAAVFAVRMLVIRYDWRTSALYRAPPA